MRKTTRIAMISEHASPLALIGGEDAGGQNVYVDELSEALAADGFEVDIFTRRDSPDTPEITEWKEGVRVINLTAGPASFIKKDLLWPYMPRLKDSFVRFTKMHEVEYALIHANFWMSGWVACRLKPVLNTPVVQTFHALGMIKRIHQGSADTSPKQRLVVEQKVVDEVDTVVATCPAEKEDLIGYYGADEQRISIIPCGVNTKVFFPVDRAEARRHLELDPEEKTIVYVGRILPRKGIDNIIVALAELTRVSDLPVRLVVVGGETANPTPDDSLELKRLESLASSLGVSGIVTFTGQRPQSVLRYYYAAADACVTTPWYEPFGMVPLESMACGTPVIASAVGGLTYTVLDGVTGFLVPPKDPKMLANKLEFLLTRPQLRDQLAARAIKRVDKFFTWSKVASRVTGLYQSLIASNVKRRSMEAAPLLLTPPSLEPDLRAPRSALEI